MLIQLSGRISVGRAGCGADLAGCVSVAGFFPTASGGLPPRLLPPSWGGDRPAPEAPLIRGMPTGPKAFLGNSGRVWATALRPDPPKKRPCATLSRSVGRGTNTAASYRSSFLLIQLSGRISAGRAGCGSDLAGCVSVAGFFLRPQGTFPLGYYLLWGLG